MRILYKYTDLNGVEKILSNRTLRFTKPSEMNDPFDVYIDDLFGMDLKEFFEASGVALFDKLLSNPREYAAACHTDSDRAIQKAEWLRKLPDSERAPWRELFKTTDLAEIDPEFKEIRNTLEKQCDEFAERFRSYGIFCATTTYSNMLMWAHYADKHRGAVLGFRPDFEKDSFLRLVRPVKYSNERPYLIEEPAQRLVLPDCTVEDGRKLNERVLYTKSPEWSYEEEWRLPIPEEVKRAEVASCLPYYANELVAIYLGYRMGNKQGAEIIRLARDVNPEVHVYAVRLAKCKYALEFEPLP